MGAIDPLKPTILFDGVCNLCNGAVLFIIKRDPNQKFQFASLQSAFGKSQLQKYNLNTKDVDSIVLIKSSKAFVRSTAALQIASQLNGLWPVLSIFKIFPTFIRDGVYNWIAKNRYSWFGKKDACMIPTPELKSRFISEM